MGQPVTIFNNAATIQLPSHYKPWAVQNDTSTSANVNAAQFLMPLTEAQGTSVTDAAFKSDDNEAFILGSKTQQDWPATDVKSLAQSTYTTLTRSLPLVRNGDINVKVLNKDKEGKPANFLHIGLLRCTFATPKQDWLCSILLMPVLGKVAALSMVATTDHLQARAMEFMGIANSASVSSEGLPKTMWATDTTHHIDTSE